MNRSILRDKAAETPEFRQIRAELEVLEKILSMPSGYCIATKDGSMMAVSKSVIIGSLINRLEAMR